MLTCQGSLKYKDHFNQDKLTNQSVNCAMANLNYSSKMTGMQEPYNNHYIKNSSVWELENRPLKIRDEMKKLELHQFKDMYPISLEVDWLSIEGRVPQTAKTTQTYSKTQHQVPEEKDIKMKGI